MTPRPTPKTENTPERTAREYDSLMEGAYEMGAEAGRAAASWYFDGNTSRATYERVLAGITEGDPHVYDTFPTSPLSGEYAGDPLPADVLAELDMTHEDDAADGVLAMYEDGFGVAVSEEIERVARYQLTDERSLAGRMAARFTQRHRASGVPFITLTDAAEEWMTDVVHEAHDDMLPDDWRYDAIAAAVEFIADTPDWDDRRDEWADGMVDDSVYGLLEWVASHGNRLALVQEARDEYGDAGESLYYELARAQFMEAREVLDLVARALETRCN